MGAYDFAFRLPPVPDGTYELRMGYTANGNRGMLQFYLGRTSSLNAMKALDIPLDMRHEPSNTTTQSGGVTTYSPDVVTGWLPYLSTEDMGIESDANMHNLGWMLPNATTSQFHLDYIEFCPENVYNNPQYVEDMY